MIYIIAGIAKSGKSYLSKLIAERFHLGYFSTDYLMMSLARGNKSLGVNPNSSDITVSNQLKPYLEAMIITMIENKIDYVIEGVHFQPNFAQDLLNRYPGKIKIVFMGFYTALVQDKVDELQKFGPKTDNYWYSSMSKDDVFTLVNYLIIESKKLFDECQKYHLPYVEIYDISSQANYIIDLLFSLNE